MLYYGYVLCCNNVHMVEVCKGKINRQINIVCIYNGVSASVVSLFSKFDLCNLREISVSFSLSLSLSLFYLTTCLCKQCLLKAFTPLDFFHIF